MSEKSGKREKKQQFNGIKETEEKRKFIHSSHQIKSANNKINFEKTRD